MRELKWHFGIVDLIYPSQMHVVCGVRLSSSNIEKNEKPFIKDRCKHCTLAMKDMGATMKGSGFWFRRRED